MGSKVKKALIVESVRDSHHNWCKQVKERSKTLRLVAIKSTCPPRSTIDEGDEEITVALGTLSQSFSTVMIVTTAGYVSTTSKVQRKYYKSLLLLVVKLLLLVLVTTARRVSGEYDMWRLRIEQYFQVQDYSLWDVIENGNSFKPAAQTTTNANGTSTSLIPGPVTTEEKAQKKNDVKERSMLLMALPNEHLMTFNQYKDAKTLFTAIQTRFGGNEATKKTQKTLLKQMYENFSAPSTESLDSIFNRLQKIVSQLAILGENISQEDLNLKFLRSLPSEWNTHVVVWRNKPDLDTMSFDDLYNNFKIVEQEVKGTASSSSSSSSQNMAFVSSPSSTNEVNTAYGVSTANTQVSPASTQVSTASTQVSTANLSDDTVYAFLASQPNGSQLVYEDLEQIHEDDIEEMDLKWQLALLSMRTRRTHRNKQDSRNKNQDSSRRTVNVEETFSKAMVAIDGASFDWSYMADDEGIVLPLNLDLSYSSLEEFQQPKFEGYGTKTSKSVSEEFPNGVHKVLEELKETGIIQRSQQLGSGLCDSTIKLVLFLSGKILNHVAGYQQLPSKREMVGHPQKEDQGYVDSGCSRHITGNNAYPLKTSKI
ncbi:hypothetical protein Tco_0862661 [Tanacetum coccineum]